MHRLHSRRSFFFAAFPPLAFFVATCDSHVARGQFGSLKKVDVSPNAAPIPSDSQAMRNLIPTSTATNHAAPRAAYDLNSNVEFTAGRGAAKSEFNPFATSGIRPTHETLDGQLELFAGSWPSITGGLFPAPARPILIQPSEIDSDLATSASIARPAGDFTGQHLDRDFQSLIHTSVAPFAGADAWDGRCLDIFSVHSGLTLGDGRSYPYSSTMQLNAVK